MIDWRLAERVAEAVAGGDGATPPLAGTADLEAMSARALERVGDYAQLRPADPPPPAEPIGRSEWSKANLATMRGTLDPLLERLGTGPLQSAGGMLIGVEAGGIVGFMGRSVLGQYELALLDPDRPPRLLLVVPNLREAARTFEADEAELLEWVVFHEITHAVQFSGVPWLREHVAGLLRELLASVKVEIDPTALLRLPKAQDLRALWDAVREGGLVHAVAGAERKALIDRLQAVMALIEGHAEHVMDAAGAAVLPSLPKLREALERRRRQKPPLVKLLERLLGLDLKLRQYLIGKRFCDDVVRDWGIEGLNRAWSAPELIPTLAELHDPPAWIRRTQVRSVTPGD
ncbi:MAG TPA: zinc-dependent metalloprotease [Solirubrobacteraceae bacterium]